MYSKSDSCIPPLNVGNETLLLDSEKADALAGQYTSVFTTDNGIFPECDQLMPENSFCSLKISEEDVLHAIRGLNGNGSPGEDEISPRFVKNIFNEKYF